jgi:hypothetical protein
MKAYGLKPNGPQVNNRALPCFPASCSNQSCPIKPTSIGVHASRVILWMATGQRGNESAMPSLGIPLQPSTHRQYFCQRHHSKTSAAPPPQHQRIPCNEPSSHVKHAAAHYHKHPSTTQLQQPGSLLLQQQQLQEPHISTPLPAGVHFRVAPARQGSSPSGPPLHGPKPTAECTYSGTGVQRHGG